MAIGRWTIVRLLLATIGLAGVLLSSCSTVTRTVMAPPEIEGAKHVGNKVCAECHTNYARSFPASPHARVYVASAKMGGLTGCECCHGPGPSMCKAAVGAASSLSIRA